MVVNLEVSMVRKELVFSGLVQGVGFRYRARHSAARNSCTGWVRNDYSGTVTMEIQGEEASINQVILDIERGDYVRIENIECHKIPLVIGEKGFVSR